MGVLQEILRSVVRPRPHGSGTNLTCKYSTLGGEVIYSTDEHSEWSVLLECHEPWLLPAHPGSPAVVFPL